MLPSGELTSASIGKETTNTLINQRTSQLKTDVKQLTPFLIVHNIHFYCSVPP